MTSKLVLFDIDGTLLLTAGAGRRAILAALGAQLASTTGLDRVRFDGKTDPQIVTELFEAAGDPEPHDPVRVAEVCHRYLGLLATELERPSTRTVLMPGVLPLLDRLEADHRVVLGLLTGNLAQGAALKLRAGGLDPDRFRVGAFGSDAAHRPELPAIAARRAASFLGREVSGPDLVIIGDTPADILCGTALSARAIAVATGGYAFADLEACGPHAVFEDLSDTERVLEAILG